MCRQEALPLNTIIYNFENGVRMPHFLGKYSIGKPNPLAGSGHTLSTCSRLVAVLLFFSYSDSVTRFHVPWWRFVLDNYPKRNEILLYIADSVDVFDFFTPFQGSFQVKRYSSDIPSEASSSCWPFSDFVSKTIMDRIANCSLHIVVRAGSCRPPYLVLPITIEPTKPRMFHIKRFLNCWI